MNKKIRKAFTRTISLLIIMVMIAGAFPFSVLADELANGGTQTPVDYVEPEAVPEADPDTAPDPEAEPDASDDSDTEDSTGDETLNDSSEVSGTEDKEKKDNSDTDIASDESNDTVTDAGEQDCAECQNGSEDPALNDEEIPDIESVPEDTKTKPVPPTNAGELNRLSITRTGSDFPSGSSYVMADTEGKEFLVNYRYADLENVILVVECLDLGADFAAIPEKNEFFNEAVLLGQGKMALRLTSAKNRTDCTMPPVGRIVITTSHCSPISA